MDESPEVASDACSIGTSHAGCWSSNSTEAEEGDGSKDEAAHFDVWLVCRLRRRGGDIKVGR